MPSDEDDVPSLIRHEPVLQTALDRGMINASGAARWLKTEYGLNLKVESIARHVREFETEGIQREWIHGRKAIEDGSHHVRSNMALLIIRRSDGARDRLAQILGDLQDAEMHAVRIEPTRRYFQVVVQSNLKEKFKRHLGQRIEEVHENLVEVSVAIDEPEGSPSPALSLALETLHQQNLAVPFATSGPAGITLLVPDEMRFEAHELIRELTETTDEG